MNCPQIKQKFAELKTLKQQFEQELEEARRDGKVRNLFALKKEIEEKLIDIKSQEGMESLNIFKEIMESEKASLEKFFGQTIEVPDLPAEVTREKIENWEKIGFKMRYLPDMDMSKDKDYPGWEKRPRNWFYKQKEDNNLPTDRHMLKSGWILVDERAKPAYDFIFSDQMYEDDPLAPAIENLRNRGIIDNYKKLGSRFNFKGSDLDNPEVIKAFAEVLQVDPKQIVLPRAIEFNTLGNMHHKEWGETNTLEWFDEKGVNNLGDFRLHGGHSGSGGLSNIDYNSSDNRKNYLGFRLLVVFS